MTADELIDLDLQTAELQLRFARLCRAPEGRADHVANARRFLDRARREIERQVARDASSVVC